MPEHPLIAYRTKQYIEVAVFEVGGLGHRGRCLRFPQHHRSSLMTFTTTTSNRLGLTFLVSLFPIPRPRKNVLSFLLVGTATCRPLGGFGGHVDTAPVTMTLVEAYILA